MSEFLCRHRNFSRTVSIQYLRDDTRSDKEKNYVKSDISRVHYRTR